MAESREQQTFVDRSSDTNSEENMNSSTDIEAGASGPTPGDAALDRFLQQQRR